jgi:hypothetical protein
MESGSVASPDAKQVLRSDDWANGNPIGAGGPLTSKPTRSSTFPVFDRVGFFRRQGHNRGRPDLPAAHLRRPGAEGDRQAMPAGGSAAMILGSFSDGN